MDFDDTQPSTQQVLDPRRLGRNNSGLNDSDISDVLCILHPSSPAAYRIVHDTAISSPQHVLQNQALLQFSLDDGPEEERTIILEQGANFRSPSDGAEDLALRFSSRTKTPFLGFCFGRNPDLCDIVMGQDSAKRVSNLHFRIFINDSGVVMLEDTSTNGTLVDETHLRGKSGKKHSTRMLKSGAMIQILSPKPEEVVKFIVRIPPREGHLEEYIQKFHDYMAFVARVAEEKEISKHRDQGKPKYTTQKTTPASKMTRPLVHSNANTFGMHWNGGDRYNVIGLLGKGAFATVYQLATAMDGQLLAAKELEKRRFIKNGQLDQRLDNEMQIMKGLRHPNIVQYIDYHDIGNHLYIIMEYVPSGDLQGYLSNNGVLPELSAKMMTQQIMSALAYLHNKNITHRDIKPDNILIANEDPFSVKLSDFGLSKVVKNNETFLKTFCGTLLYCAPEVFPHYDTHTASKGTKRRRNSGQTKAFHSYSQSVDIWSYAAVLWFSLCGSPPFEGVVDNTGRGMFDKIMGTRLNIAPLVRQGISDDAIDLLLHMLNTDPSHRPTESQCMKHRWLADGSQYDIEHRGLDAIQEEDGDAAYAEEELSQLSIHDKGARSPSDREGSEEVEIGSDEFDFFLSSHTSKRVKTDALYPRNQTRDKDMYDSSPESSVHSLAQHAEESLVIPSIKQTSMRPRLFGEIGKSALQSSGVLDEQTNQALALRDTSTSIEESESESVHSFQASPGGIAAASLFGAESMVRELNMQSPHSPNSAAATPNEPSTPKTPEHIQNLSSSHAQSDEATPKAVPINRQTSLSQTGQVYYTPFEPKSSSLHYGSQSDADNLNLEPSNASRDTLDPLSRSIPLSVHDDETNISDLATNGIGSVSQSEFIRPPPRLGKLTTTADSFKQMTLRLEQKYTSWGRWTNATIVYPDASDIAIPKHAFTIWFHADNIVETEQEGKDWTKLPGLYTGITTYTRQHITVNGVRLRPKSADGRTYYGKLHTGDVITVFDDKSSNRCLRFICEFYHGESATSRPEGVEFRALKENPRPSMTTVNTSSTTPA